MGRHGFDRFLIFLVHEKSLAFFGFAGILSHKGGDLTMLVNVFPQLLPQLGVLGNDFGNNISGALHSFLPGIYLQLWVDVFAGFLFHTALGILLPQNSGGQRLQALFSRLLCSGAFLLLKGEINILQLLQLGGFFNGLLQLLRELSLFGDFVKDFLLAFDKIPKIGQALFQLSKLFILQLSCGFLAVSGDKGDCVSFIQKLDGGLGLLRADIQLLGQGLGYIF